MGTKLKKRLYGYLINTFYLGCLSYLCLSCEKNDSSLIIDMIVGSWNVEKQVIEFNNGHQVDIKIENFKLDIYENNLGVINDHDTIFIQPTENTNNLLWMEPIKDINTGQINYYIIHQFRIIDNNMNYQLWTTREEIPNPIGNIYFDITLTLLRLI